MLLALFVILALVSISFNYFLGWQYKKKFGFMGQFVRNSNQMLRWVYHASTDTKTGMRNIVLRGEKPFCALIGFHLTVKPVGLSGFDYYGFVKSDASNTAVIATYMGKHDCEFLFYVNTDLVVNRVAVSSTDDDQRLQSHVDCSPHWYQRLGFYG